MNASKVCLNINFKKTKILHAGHNSQPSPFTTINGYTLEICNDFLYLGVSTTTPLNVVQEKIGRAWFAIGKLRPIFISKISDVNKMRLFKATVETIAVYGLESVPMTRFPCSLRALFLRLTFNLKIQCLSYYMTMPTNTVCHSQLIYDFTQSQHKKTNP